LPIEKLNTEIAHFPQFTGKIVAQGREMVLTRRGDPIGVEEEVILLGVTGAQK